MKIIVLSILALFVGALAFSQERTFEWTERKGTPKSYARIDKHLATEGDSHFVVWKGTAAPGDPLDFWIEQTSHSSGQSSLIAFSFTQRMNSTKPIRFSDIYRLKKRNYITYTEYDKKQGLNAISIMEIKADGSKGKPIQLVNLEPTGLIYSGDYNIAVSPDQSKLIVLGFEGYRRKGESQLISLTCVNTEDMSIIWSKEHFLPTNSQKLPKNSICVDNEGNCVFYNKFKDRGEGFKSSIFGYNVQDNALTNFDLKLIGEQFIQSQKLEVNEKGEFIFNGLYKDDGLFPKGNTLHGRVYVKVTKGKNLVSNYASSFSQVFLDAAEYRPSKDETPYLTGFHIITSHHREDGKSVILFERISGLKNVIPGTNPVQYETFTVRLNIIALCVNTNTGEMEWITTIPKNQQLSDSRSPRSKHEVSFVSVLQGNIIRIFYNNTSINKDWKENDGSTYNKFNVFGSNTGLPVFEYLLEEDGSLTYSNLKYGLPLKDMFKAENRYPLTMNPTLSFVFEGNVYFGTTYNGVQYRYCKLNIQ